MGLFSDSHPVVCVFCKLQRRVYKKKDISLLDIFLLLVVSGFFSFILWGEPHLHSLLIFMGLVFSLQFFLRIRFREGLKCPHCGLDIHLYGTQREQAALKVRDFLVQRKENPEYLLKPQPQIQPPKEKKLPGPPRKEKAPENPL